MPQNHSASLNYVRASTHPHALEFREGDLAPHEWLLLECLRESAGVTTEPKCHAVDLLSLLHLAQAHKVVPHVHRHLTALGLLSSAAPDVTAEWARSLNEGFSHFYWRKAQWIALRTQLRKVGVEGLPIKGAALIFDHYREPIRAMGDFDVLVRSSDLMTVHTLMEKEGYRAASSPSRHLWWEELYHCQLRQGRHGRQVAGRITYYPVSSEAVIVDVHWNPRYPVGNNYIRLVPEVLWSQAARNENGELGLSVPHLFLTVLVHAAQVRHTSLIHWMDVRLLSETLSRIADIPALIRETPALDANQTARESLIKFHEEVLTFNDATPSSPLRRCLANDRLAPGHGDQPDPYRSVEGYFGAMKVRLEFLTPGQRAKWFLGFWLPELSYYEGKSAPAAALLFMRDSAIAVTQMLLRVWRHLRQRS